jgi:beta-phosphoglucomutase-like phosphatase (HAD superfamily)
LFIHLIKHGLTKNDIINGVKQLIDHAKERDLKLIAVSTSANAKLEMKCMELNNKFDYISDYSVHQLSSLSAKEKTNVSNVLFALHYLGLRTDECIGLEDHIDGIREYNHVGIYSVAIANYDDTIKLEANYSVDLPEQINLEEIIFNYYKKDSSDI